MSLGPVSFQGLASGLNVSAIIQKLMAVDELPLQEITNQEATVTQQQTAWSNLSSALQSFVSTVQGLSQNLFQGMTATSTSPSVVTATATAGAVAANYNLAVNQLAQPEIDSSTGFASATQALGLSGSFTVNGQSVTVNPTDTLTDVANAINASGAGVTAMIVNTGATSNPYELWITANTTGTAAAITYQDTNGTPLEGLGLVSPSTGAKNVLQAAQDASFTVNGVPFSSGSNTVTGALPNITLDLVAPGTATITVAPDNQSVASAVQSFVNAYNNLVNIFQQDLAPTGPLAGNATVQTVWNELSQALFSPVPTGTSIQSLADIGVTFVQAQIGSSSNGTLQLNSTALQNALNTNLQGVEALFTGTGGLVSTLANLVNPVSGPGGVIPQIQNSLSDEQNQLQSEQNALQQQLNQEQSTLQAEFNNMETYISQLEGQAQLLGYFGAGLVGPNATTGAASGTGTAGRFGSGNG
jgi:flagellar hook-associated protein 2